MLEDVAIGETTEVVSARPGLALPVAVLLPRVAGPVVAVSVQLHREPEGRPPTVHAVAADGAIRLRQHKTVIPKEVEDAAFELAERDTALSVQDRPKAFRSSSVRPASERGFDRFRRRPVADAGFVECAGEIAERQNRRDVHERALDRGHRDPA
jgi:hypothetical protein